MPVFPALVLAASDSLRDKSVVLLALAAAEMKEAHLLLDLLVQLEPLLQLGPQLVVQ